MFNLKRILLLFYFLSGFAALIYEVVWTQLLTLSFGTSTYSFSLMLAAFFTGLCLGGYAAGKYIDGRKDALRLLTYLEIGIGSAGMLTLLLFDKMGMPLDALYRISGSFYPFMASVFFLSFLFMLLPTTMMGATLPVISKIYADNKESIGRDMGAVFSFNTFGAIFGSFSAGFILIPVIGLSRTTVVAALLNISAAFVIFNSSKRESRSRFYAVISVVLLMAVYMSSFIMQPAVTGVYRIGSDTGGQHFGGVDVLYYGSNAYGTVAVANEGKDRSLWINNKVDASTTPVDMSTQLLLGYLPMFANPGAGNVLNIGLGGGFSLGAIEAFDVSAIDAIELNPLVNEATGKYFRDLNGNALEDRRINLITADARNYLSTSNKKYDVIVSEPSNLWVSGESSLFTKEFYIIVREHLNKSGVFSQWIPLYDFSEEDTRVFLRTLKEVFPEATLWISGTDGIIIASMDPVALNHSYIVRMMEQNPRIKNDLNRMTEGFGDFSDEYREVIPEMDLPDTIIKSFALSDEDIETYAVNASLHTDDFPVLEFNTARNFLFLKDKYGSIESIKEYLHNKRDSIIPVSNIEHRDGDWLYLDFMGLKINTVNWSKDFSGYGILGYDSIKPSDRERYSKLASFSDNLSSLKIITQQSALKTFNGDSRDVAYVKNIQRQAEVKELFLKRYPFSEIIEFKKNGHSAYRAEYMQGQMIKGMIGWYCEVNNLIYLVDVDAYDSSGLMRVNDDVLCVHEKDLE